MENYIVRPFHKVAGCWLDLSHNAIEPFPSLRAAYKYVADDSLSMRGPSFDSMVNNTAEAKWEIVRKNGKHEILVDTVYH